MKNNCQKTCKNLINEETLRDVKLMNITIIIFNIMQRCFYYFYFLREGERCHLRLYDWGKMPTRIEQKINLPRIIARRQVGMLSSITITINEPKASVGFSE